MGAEFETDGSETDESGMGESGMDEEGRLDLFGGADAGGEGPPGSPWDDEVDAGWEPGVEPAAWEDRGDGPESWLRSLPPELRAEVEARPPAIAAWEAGPGEVRAGFACGGYFDAMLPGAGLGEVLAAATSEGYCGLTDDELAGVLRGWQRQVAHDQASLAVAVACLADRRAAGSSRAAEHVADELAVELTLTGRSAARQLELAAGLARLGEVRDALLSGFIDWARACVFTDELAVVDAAAARHIVERLIDPAAGWTTGQLRAALARAVLAADPGAAQRRRKHARAETRVELWREGSGNAALAGRELRPAAAVLLDKKLTSDAQWLAACGVPGTQDQLRALAYTTLLSGRDLAAILDDPASWPHRDDQAAQPGPAGNTAGSTGDAGDRGDGSADGRPAGTAGGARRGSAGNAGGAPAGDPATAVTPGALSEPAVAAQPESAAGGRPEPAAGSIHLTMPLSAWESGGEPGEVAGHGPVDAETSRELAGLLGRDPATRWCLTVTGPAGQAVAHACARRGPAGGEPVLRWAAGLRDRLLVLESGTCRHAREAAGYVPPPRLRHLIMVRQRRCSFPGCRRPARQCDLDHTIAYDQGGRTCECNLAPLCRRHHRAKQAPGWQLAQGPPGEMTWRLPSGRTFTTAGDCYSSYRP